MAADTTHPVMIEGYAIYGEIASGGTSTVHFGRLLGPGGSRVVAVKRLHRHLLDDPELRTMLIDEARLAARIRHPNVLTIVDVLATETEVALVLDYVHGDSLSSLLRALLATNGRIPVSILVAIVAGVLRGLHAAHEARDEQGKSLQIVHRDVSPQNILVGADGVSRVLDFGIAKAAGRSRTTRDGRVRGKIAYMPPEQLHGEVLDRRVDVYAASVVLWEGLTGRALFAADDDAEVVTRTLTAFVHPPSSIVESISPALDAVVMRGLDRDPSKRFASAEQMARAIEACEKIAPRQEVAAWVTKIAAARLDSRSTEIAAIESSSRRLPQMDPRPVVAARRRWVWIPAAASILGVAILALARYAPRSEYFEQRPRPLGLTEPTAPEPSTAAAPSGPESLATSQAQTPSRQAAPSRTVSKEPQADCKPPYTIDSAGHKRFKKECL